MMKMRALTGILLFLAGVATGAEKLEFWDFSNDPAGTTLDKLTNSGTMGSSWNRGAKSIVTDGEGHLLLKGGAGTLTRKLPKQGKKNAMEKKDFYASPLAGKETYVLELNLASWKFSSMSAGDSMTLKAVDSEKKSVVLISIKALSDTKSVISLFHQGGKFKAFKYSPERNRPLPIKIKFNFSTGMVEYYINETKQCQLANFSGSNIAGLTFQLSGKWKIPSTSILIDSMGLSTEDEILQPPTAQ
jgi:hypothetical protein